MNDIMVSIICATFNHEKYIKRALDSFLMQKLKYKFEVVIHDDASTDNTPKIIKEYEKKYPDIFSCIYANENRTSKGVSVFKDYLIPASKGKYIAFCEGDDYFVDPLKLQKQVDYMESHPDCTLCVHAAEIVSVDEKRIQLLCPRKESGVIPPADVIKGGGGFVATNSIMFPSRIVKHFPNFFSFGEIYDYVWQMYFASQGTTYYLSDVMSAYRKGDPSSWSNQTQINTQRNVSREISKQKILRQFDEDTNYKFHDAVKSRIQESKFYIYMWTRNKKLKKDKDVIAYRKSIPRYNYYSMLLRTRTPHIYIIVHTLNIKIRLIKSNIK